MKPDREVGSTCRFDFDADRPAVLHARARALKLHPLRAMTHQPAREQFRDLIHGFTTAMLVTHSDHGTLRGRPMTVASVEPNGDLWFATGVESHKASELLRDARVVVIMQSSNRFVSVSGEAELVVNTKKANELWRESWRPWFPKGPEDPELALVRVHSREAEFWNLGGMKGVRYLFDAVRHALRGERMSDAPSDHHGRLGLGETGAQ